jgi:hypothetical protein
VFFLFPFVIITVALDDTQFDELEVSSTAIAFNDDAEDNV